MKKAVSALGIMLALAAAPAFADEYMQEGASLSLPGYRHAVPATGSAGQPATQAEDPYFVLRQDYLPGRPNLVAPSRSGSSVTSHYRNWRQDPADLQQLSRGE